jgi:SUMO ligase MMS21 Smc5/6 complex component
MGFIYLIILVILVIGVIVGMYYWCYRDSPEDFEDLDIESVEPEPPEPELELKTSIMNSDLENECSICLEKFKTNEKIIILECKHYFHYGCANKWVNISRVCPVCRAKQGTA